MATRFRAGALWRGGMWALILAAVAGVTVVAAWRMLRPQVTVTHIAEGPIVQAFYATGTLLPEREYPIKANLAGILTKVHVDKGDRVKLGQPLGEVIDDAVLYRYDQAVAERKEKAKLADEKTSPIIGELEARIAGLTDLLDLAKRERDRVAKILEAGSSNQMEFDRAIDRLKTLWVDLEAARGQLATRRIELAKELEIADAALKIAKWNLDQQTLRSPIDKGVVLDRPLSIGTRVAINDHIMQIADVRPENLVMRAAVDEEDKTSVRQGQLVHMTLYAFPGKVFAGKVKKIYDKADPDRRTFEVDVEMMEKNAGYAAGMTGELAFVIDRKESATVIPRQSVQSGQVYVVRNGRIEQAQARLGLLSVERAEVISGLSPADAVLLSPIGDLKAGQAVRTKSKDPRDAAVMNRPKEAERFKGGF